MRPSILLTVILLTLIQNPVLTDRSDPGSMTTLAPWAIQAEPTQPHSRNMSYYVLRHGKTRLRICREYSPHLRSCSSLIAYTSQVSSHHTSLSADQTKPHL
ncbi:hypothetical protein PILCRDRAFT_499833 [Piloderma croceum F 1598]|uniref:Secreted protein n=1 Tax=Piloderma croceum (strain F 1598) TaxID=765440 RepID=A0A0C3FQD2_PILCF|nr:hypothetical protein PILCRDRAFT_499833 [Piloderma croceum F 1598]